MAKVRKARYIYQDGVYYEVGGGGNEDEILARLNNMILVQDDEPTTPDNKIWIKETATPVVIPEMSDIADFVSFVEDQTSRTDAEKAQARSNIGAEKPWTKVWENASYNSSFPGQTLNVDLTGYSELKVIFQAHVTSSGGLYTDSAEGVVGGSVRLINMWGGKFLMRSIENPSVTTIDVGDGKTVNSYGSSEPTANDACIPYRIYAR